ncbi:MAG: hypothetical protein ACI8Y4_003655 [Candidatus Poriferisodalaceae bacterium]|jgi:hypothetical protein
MNFLHDHLHCLSCAAAGPQKRVCDFGNQVALLFLASPREHFDTDERHEHSERFSGSRCDPSQRSGEYRTQFQQAQLPRDPGGVMAHTPRGHNPLADRVLVGIEVGDLLDWGPHSGFEVGALGVADGEQADLCEVVGDAQEFSCLGLVTEVDGGEAAP